MSDEPQDKARPQGRPGRTGRGDGRREERRPSLRGLARRILGDDEPLDLDDDPDLDPEERQRRSEARALLSAVLETGDKAKTETVRMIAREVRGYLEALELHKDLHHLLTNYSLEVKASIHLAPLDEEAAAKGPRAEAGLKRKAAPAGGSDEDGPVAPDDDE